MAHETTALPERKLLWIRGPDAPGFLQGLITADVHSVKETTAAYAGLLSPQGKILFDFMLVAREDGFLLDCPASQRELLIRRLNFYKLRANITIAPDDTLAVFAIADERANTGFPDPRHASMGRRHYGSVQATGSPNSYHARRIELGLGEGVSDFETATLFPHEANFDQIGAVSFSKGCFVGQEVVSRMEHRGTARSRILPMVAEGRLPAKGMSVTTGEKTIGTVLSGEGNRALALLRLDKLKEAFIENAAIVAEGAALFPYPPAWAKFDVPDFRRGGSEK